MGSMKRSREDGVTDQSLDMAKCLTLLSTELDSKTKRRSPNKEAFECKTCHREFSSFQALGGHRASHKRPRPVVSDDKMVAKLVSKPKMHECTICGLEFAMGQALGGHMRRHRALLMGESFPEFRLVHGHDRRLEEAAPVVPVLRRSSSSCGRRVFGMDLNLTPLENDLAVLFGKRVFV